MASANLIISRVQIFAILGKNHENREILLPVKISTTKIGCWRQLALYCCFFIVNSICYVIANIKERTNK